MRPYFFKRVRPSVDKRAAAYQDSQRAAAPQRGLLRSFLGLLRSENGAGLPPGVIKVARQKALAAAVAKRERVKARNLRWWSKDRTWEFNDGRH